MLFISSEQCCEIVSRWRISTALFTIINHKTIKMKPNIINKDRCPFLSLLMYQGTVFPSEAQHILIGLFGRNNVQVISDKIALLLKTQSTP